ncbi:hypothetical protein TESG_04336 [Trichophyton tonsurans CBS 112818]|uniref:Arylsulfotransferase n=2 Tax=Trichophyton TaxID=5550 RepID=F2PQN1_TRIEC|nr:hypothetical protein TESG_04336 [Trichophyton tonsurans CBS 112818]EGE04199.1 hypothetical protein TEQG_03230 [Trichophyton equinum CBS 127.97]
MLRLNPLSSSCLATLLATYLGAASVSAQSPPENLWPVQTFQSTDIQTPFFNVTKKGQTEPGYIFFTPRDKARKIGHPAIFDDNGQVVWKGPEDASTYGFKPQLLDGKPVMVSWFGFANETGFGLGSMSIFDSSYEKIHEVILPGGDNEYYKTIYEPKTFPSYMDNHEGQITDQGTIVVTVVNVTEADLRAVGGPEKGWVVDGGFLEMDIKTNDVLFRWSAAEHFDEIPVTFSLKPLDGAGTSSKDPWNYIHVNSVYKSGDSYIVSSRYSCNIFLISKEGKIVWRLNGIDGGDFELGPGTNFCYQHEVRVEEHTVDKITLTTHNNDNADFTPDDQTKPTTGLVLDLDLNAKKVSLNRMVWNSQQPVVSRAQGSYQVLGNHHVLMGQGAIPVIEEYDANGAIVMDARFGNDGVTNCYRAYRSAWVGTPKTKPSVKACGADPNGAVVFYVSWNGATDVDSWKVFSVSDSGEVKEIANFPKNGFETRMELQKAGSKFVVQAVGGPNDGVQSDAVMGENC